PPFCAFFGTSAAAPHSAGIAALLLDQDPTLTPAEVQAALTRGAVDIGPPGFDDASGFGRIDALASAETSTSSTTTSTTSSTSTTSTTIPAVRCGDVNGDGVVDIGDALLVAQFDVGLRRCGVAPFTHPEVCDVNGDGSCNIGDTLRLAQCDVGLVGCTFTC